LSLCAGQKLYFGIIVVAVVRIYCNACVTPQHGYLRVSIPVKVSETGKVSLVSEYGFLPHESRRETVWRHGFVVVNDVGFAPLADDIAQTIPVAVADIEHAPTYRPSVDFTEGISLHTLIGQDCVGRPFRGVALLAKIVIAVAAGPVLGDSSGERGDAHKVDCRDESWHSAHKKG
jgi:hypothetical protein